VSPTQQDVALVAISLLAVSLLMVAARAGARTGRVSATALRKFLHAAVGAWTLFVTPRFHHLGWALVPPILFLIVNGSPLSRTVLRGFADTPAQGRGLWSFPAGVAIVYLLFWDSAGRPAILAGLLALAFADPIAAVVGSRIGQRRFRGFGHGRSLEGSLAFLLVAAVGAGLVASTHAGGAFPWRMGIACGVAGAATEALTPSGWDNVTIPVLVAGAYRLLA
jgi:dolichol kinase